MPFFFASSADQHLGDDVLERGAAAVVERLQRLGVLGRVGGAPLLVQLAHGDRAVADPGGHVAGAGDGRGLLGRRGRARQEEHRRRSGTGLSSWIGSYDGLLWGDATPVVDTWNRRNFE